MRISEAAERVGLDISSVRFYERKGLIAPSRAEDSKYRDYTEEDVLRLKQIILLRKLDLSIEDIRHILLEGGDVSEMLQSQQGRLELTGQKIQSSLSLCKRMLQDGVDLNGDVDFWLDFVGGEEAEGGLFPSILPIIASRNL